MRVKVGEEVYDGVNLPIMVILTEEDRFNISRMPKKAARYAQYPDTWTEEDIEGWMEVDDASTKKCKESRFK